MKDTIWIIKTGKAYNVFENKAQAEAFLNCADETSELVKYEAVHIIDRDWKTDYEEEAKKLDSLSVELDGLRTAFAGAKAESEKRINVAMDELRVARSDVHTLEEVIVKMAMRLVGM